MVSSDFGKLDVRRHLISGAPCAIAGAATSVVAPATAPPLRNVRRFMMGLSLNYVSTYRLERDLRELLPSYSGIQVVSGSQDGAQRNPGISPISAVWLSEQLGADEQHAHGVGRLHDEHGVLGGAFERRNRVFMQRAEFHPLDRFEAGEELIGLADGRDRQRVAVQLDLERRAQRGLGTLRITHGLLLNDDGLTKGKRQPRRGRPISGADIRTQCSRAARRSPMGLASAPRPDG